MEGKLSERLFHTLLDADPNTTNAVNYGITEVSTVRRAMYGISPAIIAGAGPSAIKIIGSATLGMSNPVDLKTHAAPATMDAVGDFRFLEVSQDEIVAAGDTIRYIALSVAAGTSTDEFKVSQISEMLHAAAGQTVDVTT